MTPQQGLTGYIIRTGRPLLATREDIERLVQQGQVERLGSDECGLDGRAINSGRGIDRCHGMQIYTSGSHYDQETLHLLEFRLHPGGPGD